MTTLLARRFGGAYEGPEPVAIGVDRGGLGDRHGFTRLIGARELAGLVGQQAPVDHELAPVPGVGEVAPAAARHGARAPVRVAGLTGEGPRVRLLAIVERRPLTTAQEARSPDDLGAPLPRRLRARDRLHGQHLDLAWRGWGRRVATGTVRRGLDRRRRRGRRPTPRHPRCRAWPGAGSARVRRGSPAARPCPALAWLLRSSVEADCPWAAKPLSRHENAGATWWRPTPGETATDTAREPVLPWAHGHRTRRESPGRPDGPSMIPTDHYLRFDGSTTCGRPIAASRRPSTASVAGGPRDGRRRPDPDQQRRLLRRPADVRRLRRPDGRTGRAPGRARRRCRPRCARAVSSSPSGSTRSASTCTVRTAHRSSRPPSTAKGARGPTPP